MTLPPFPQITDGSYYFTLPIIEFDSNIIKEKIGTSSEHAAWTLQQNINDVVYGVFYSPSSEFKVGFEGGYSEGDLYSALLTALESTIKIYENISKAGKYTYIIDSINIKSFSIVGDTVSTSMGITSGSLVMPVNLTVTKSLI